PSRRQSVPRPGRSHRGRPWPRRRRGPPLATRSGPTASGNVAAEVAGVDQAGAPGGYAGYIGGGGIDIGYAISPWTRPAPPTSPVPPGAAYVTGFTTSFEDTFPGHGGAGPDRQRRLRCLRGQGGQPPGVAAGGGA